MVEKLEGNIDLKEALPHGVIKKITETFGYKHQGFVGEVIAGTKNGNTLLIECADRIVSAYEDCGFEDKLEKILKDYESTNN